MVENTPRSKSYSLQTVFRITLTGAYEIVCNMHKNQKEILSFLNSKSKPTAPVQAQYDLTRVSLALGVTFDWMLICTLHLR